MAELMKKFPENDPSHNEQPDSTEEDTRIIQIHPSLRCNLACKHCYSFSGPNAKDFLKVEDLIRFLTYSHAWGFNVTSVSGGEPFLYPQLPELLAASRSLGNKNMAASNGMLFGSAHAKEALQLLDLVAVSIDGRRNFHDKIRNQKGAYDKMLNGLRVLRNLQIPFGLIHTLTENSWRQLLWLAHFAFRQGARLLQLHPLELTGRAQEQFFRLMPSPESLYKTYIISNYLQEDFGGKMKIHIDFMHRQSILRNPSLISFFGDGFILGKNAFASVIKCLIVDECGDIYPMSYGFNPYFKIGNIAEVTSRDMFSEYMEGKAAALYRIIADTYRQISINETGEDLIAWTEMIVKNSYVYRPEPAVA